jgi:hypothetical protein
MGAVRTTADALSVSLEQVKAVEEMRSDASRDPGFERPRPEMISGQSACVCGPFTLWKFTGRPGKTLTSSVTSIYQVTVTLEGVPRSTRL